MAAPYHNTRLSKKTASTSPTNEEDVNDPSYTPPEPDFGPLKRGRSNNFAKRAGKKKSSSVRMPDLSNTAQLWSSESSRQAFEEGLILSYLSVGKADGVIVQRIFASRSMPHTVDQVTNRIHNTKIPINLPPTVAKTMDAVRAWLLPLLYPSYNSDDAFAMSLIADLNEGHAFAAAYSKDKGSKTNLLKALNAGRFPGNNFLPPTSDLPHTTPTTVAVAEPQAPEEFIIAPLPTKYSSPPPAKKRMDRVICDIEVTEPSFGRKRCVVWGWYDEKFFIVVEPPLGASVSVVLERSPFRHLTISITHAPLRASLTSGVGDIGTIAELLNDNSGEVFNTSETETITVKLPNLTFPETPIHNVCIGKDVEIGGTNGRIFSTALQVLCMVYKTHRYVPVQ